MRTCCGIPSQVAETHGILNEENENCAQTQSLRSNRILCFDPDVYLDVNECMQLDGTLRESSLQQRHLPTLENALVEFSEVFSSSVDKPDSTSFDNGNDVPEGEPTGTVSSLLDCLAKSDEGMEVSIAVKENGGEKFKKVIDDTSYSSKSRPRNCKARKSVPVKREQSVAETDLSIEDGDVVPTLIAERKKRRMSSNRASAQRSRQRKQDRLDELELLTARLRLQNATLLRKLNLATQLAKKFEAEKNDFARKVEHVSKELHDVKSLYSDVPSMCSMNGTISPRMTYVSNYEKPVEGFFGLDPMVVNLEGTTGMLTSPSFIPGPSCTQVPVAKEQVLPETDPQISFQQLCAAFESDMFDLREGADVPHIIEEKWLESFSEFLKS